MGDYNTYHNPSVFTTKQIYFYNRKIFIVAWITYIYVWQRFERYFSHHRAKWIDLFPLNIVLTRKLALLALLALFPFELDETLKRDPTESIKRECLKKLKSLKNRNIIDQSLYYKLKPTDSPAPRFYGLPKIHKQGIPIRPIVSYTGTPLYKISKHVANILTTKWE